MKFYPENYIAVAVVKSQGSTSYYDHGNYSGQELSLHQLKGGYEFQLFTSRAPYSEGFK